MKDLCTRTKLQSESKTSYSCRGLDAQIVERDWAPLLSTPPHPEFPSGHSQTGGAFAAALISMFGNNYPLTLHTYDNLNMAPRSYDSFTQMVEDIGKSRVYGGIHFSYTCIESAKQGSKIANNVLNRLKFKK